MIDNDFLKLYNSIDYSKFNKDILAFVKENDIKSPTEYLIITSLALKYTYIFKQSLSGWRFIYKWACTVGKPSTPTIKGIFNISGKESSFGTNTYSVKYATRIIDGYYYHSVLYNPKGTYIIDGRLGLALSHGCIRLKTENAKWIYENIPNGTTVIIY